MSFSVFVFSGESHYERSCIHLPMGICFNFCPLNNKEWSCWVTEQLWSFTSGLFSAPPPPASSPLPDCPPAVSRVLRFQRELCRWSSCIFLKVSEQEVGIVSGKNMGHQVGHPWEQEQGVVLVSFSNSGKDNFMIFFPICWISKIHFRCLCLSCGFIIDTS